MIRTDDPLIHVEGLEKHFAVRRSLAQTMRSQNREYVKAVAGVNLEINRGESLGLVGQSGCGKTTLGMMLALLEKPTGGTISFDGQDISRMSGRQLRKFRRNVQVIFQDPYDSLNPRYRVQEAVLEPLNIHKNGIRGTRRDLVAETLAKVGLRPVGKYLAKYPYELSGGERQRVAIARAIVLNPSFLVADEPVSMLDVSVRAAILSLMRQLQAEMQLTYLFITHDLSVARYMCDRIAIMYFGNIVEHGPTDSVLHNPVHPYTKRLIDSVPIPDPTIKRSESNRIVTFDRNRSHISLVEVEPGHFVADT